jgi:hypothetical protein
LKEHGLITSPAFILLKAANRFANPTTAPSGWREKPAAVRCLKYAEFLTSRNEQRRLCWLQ